MPIKEHARSPFTWGTKSVDSSLLGPGEVLDEHGEGVVTSSDDEWSVSDNPFAGLATDGWSEANTSSDTVF
jgi:hypothetical protein